MVANPRYDRKPLLKLLECYVVLRRSLQCMMFTR
jgi:hypothetical protein